MANEPTLSSTNSSGPADPYADEAPLSPIDEWSPAKRLVTGLQRRRMGAPPQPFQAEMLDAFDAADLPGKRAMLAEYWPLWEPIITASNHKRS